MADYSFSSSAMRKRKSNFKTKPVLGDSSGPPPPSITPQTPSVQTSSSPSPLSTSPQSKTGSGSEKDTKESISPVQPSNISGNNHHPHKNNTSSSSSSKVQQYIQNLNHSKWPPAMVSDDSDHEISLPVEKTKSRPGTGKPQPQKPQTGKAFTREPPLDDSSVDSMDDDSSSSSSTASSSGSAQSQSTTSSSDDSEHETTKKIDKYRLKYLNGNIDGKNYGKPTKEKGSPTRDSEIEDVPTTYHKYKKQFNESKRSDEKWLSPKKKLGAPPEIDYNYRYLNAPKVEEKSQALPDTNTKQPKKKLDLKSQKIGKDDLGILASMLGDDSSTGEVSSHGIFSTCSDDDSGVMRSQQRMESVKKLNQKPGSLRGVSNDSVKSNNKDTIREGDTEDLEAQSLEGVHSIGGGKEKPLSPKERVSIRLAKVQQERREKEANSFSSHSARSMTSDLDEHVSSPAPEIKN